MLGLATNPGDLLMQNGSTINNSGTWDLQNDSYVYLYTGASNTFNNTGTFQKSGGTTATTTSGVYGSDGTFKNSGQVLAKAGAHEFPWHLLANGWHHLPRRRRHQHDSRIL